MKTKLVASLFVLSMFAQGCVVVSDDGDSTLTIVNDSNYVMTELYIIETYAGDDFWGDNVLAGGGPLFPGDEIIIDLECGTYDVLVVDEDGYECLFPDEDLCFDNDIWYVACGPQFAAASNAAANESVNESVNESTASDAL